MTLTPEQLEALRHYAKSQGKNWKDQLSAAWMSGRDASRLHGHLLRQIRNGFGPVWLEAFEFPK